MFCNVHNFNSSLVIVDPYNTTQANCSALNNTFICDALPDIVTYFNSLKSEIILYWDSLYELTIGKWLCIHGTEVLEMYINPTKGKITD